MTSNTPSELLPADRQAGRQQKLFLFYHDRGRAIVVVSIVMLDDVAKLVLVVLMYCGALFLKG